VDVEDRRKELQYLVGCLSAKVSIPQDSFRRVEDPGRRVSEAVGAKTLVTD